MLFYRVRQLLQFLLLGTMIFSVCFLLYQGFDKIKDNEIIKALTMHSEEVIEEKELLSILLNAYYMGLSMDELEAEIISITGSKKIAEDVKKAFLEAGGGEAYIRQLTELLNEKE